MGTMTLSAGVLMKAGANVSTDMYSGANGKTGLEILEEFIEQAEADIFLITRYDWVTNWASVNANAKKALTDLCESIAAMMAINYDTDGYGLNSAQTKLDLLTDRKKQLLEVLRLNENQEIIV